IGQAVDQVVKARNRGVAVLLNADRDCAVKSIQDDEAIPARLDSLQEVANRVEVLELTTHRNRIDAINDLVKATVPLADSSESCRQRLLVQLVVDQQHAARRCGESHPIAAGG